MTSEADVRIAYFSMEIAADPRFSTYAGGLGVLAGDTLRSAADLGIPMVFEGLGANNEPARKMDLVRYEKSAGF